MIASILLFFNFKSSFLSRFSVSVHITDISKYHMFFVHVMISLETDGIEIVSLIISFSKTSFVPSLFILSIRKETVLHFRHLICFTASFIESSFVGFSSIITILSNGNNHHLKAGESFIISSINT